MKKRLIITIVLILSLAFTLASCSNKRIDNIEIAAGTAPTEVYVDEQPDFSATKLIVTYNDGTSREIAASEAVIGKIDTSKPGRVSYEISYEGFSVNASITVKAKGSVNPPATQATLTGITYLSGLNTSLFVGGELDTTVLKVTATYSDGSTKTIESKDLTTNIDKFDKFAVGTQTLEITYGGKSCSVNITVQAVEVVDVTIDYSTIDTAKTYFVGDTVVTTGVTGKAIYNNGTTKDLVSTDFTFSAIDNTTAGKKTLAITYAGITKNIEFSFVAIAPVSLTHVSGTIPGVLYGEQLDTSAITAILKYNNGATQSLTASDLTFTEIDTATPGAKALKATYGDFSFTVAYTVLDITEAEVLGVNHEVKLDTDIDCTNVQLKLTLSDSTTRFVTKGVTVDKTAFSAGALGKTSITVNYKNESIVFEIDVVEIVGDATLVGIQITGGLKAEIYEGQSFSAEGIELIARFSDNQFLNLNRSDVTIEGTVGATPGTYTLTVKFTYEGVTKECTYTVTVVELRVINLLLNLDKLEFERYRSDAQPSLQALLSNLTAIAYYNDGSNRSLTLNDLTLGTVDFFTAGEQTLAVTFEEGSATVQVTVKEPTVTDVKLVGEFANKHIKGEVYDLSDAKAEVHYSNGEIVVMDNALSNATFDEATGVLTVTFDGKSATKSITLLTINKVVIDTETFNTAPELNKFSTDGLKLIVYLSDGSNVLRDVTNGVTIDASAVNAAVSGIYDMTASYMGVTSDPVNIFVVEDDRYVITGAAYPDGIALWKANKLQENFLDKGYNYAVGIANPFRFEIKLTHRDIETDEIFTKYLAYKGVSKVYDMNGNEVGEDIVVIDDEKHTFHFTRAALGNCYRITTRPEKIADGAEALFTRELTVEIVDGFNVHDEIELNVLTNKDASIADSGYRQLTTVYEFMKNNVDFAREMTLEDYIAFINSFDGIVLHDFLKLEPSNFPEKYFFVTKDGTKYLWDHFALYYHELWDSNAFNFYGNYFEIDTSAIPCVAPAGTYDRNGVLTNNTAGDPTSNSEVFRFRTAEEILKGMEVENPDAPETNPTFDHTAYKANFYAFAMSDNDKSTAEQEAAERLRSTLGIYAFKIAKAEYSFHAVNIQRYYISVMNEYDCLTVNYDYCTFYDSWNNHISIWSENTIDSADDETNANIHKGHTNIKINIANSFMAKCGGPVIMSMNSDPTASCNQFSGPEVVVDEASVIYSYVTGQESWFINYGATDVVGTIVGLSEYFFKPNAQYTTTITASGKDFVNMIYLNLSGAGLLGLADDVDGKITIGGKTLVDMNDTSIYLHPVTGAPTQGNYANAYVDTVMTGAKLLGGKLPPIFVSSEGGCTHFNGTTLDQTMGDIFKGDHLTLYYNNMGILMGYNEKQIEKEPVQRENTTIERVTEPHGYAQAAN